MSSELLKSFLTEYRAYFPTFYNAVLSELTKEFRDKL